MIILQISSFTTAITQAVLGAVKRLSKSGENTNESKSNEKVESDTFEIGQEDRNEKYKAQLKQLSTQKAELITNFLNGVGKKGNSTSKIKAELRKIEAKGAILREVLGLPPGKVELPEETIDSLTTELEEIFPHNKDEIVAKLINNAGSGKHGERFELLKELGVINAKGAFIREALGLPKGTVDLPDESQITYTLMMEELAAQKDSLIQRMLEIAGRSSSGAMEELQTKVGAINFKISIIREVLGIKSSK